MNGILESIKLDNKYEMVLDQRDGKFEFYVNRYNDKKWVNLQGAGMPTKMFISIFYEVQELREENRAMNSGSDNLIELNKALNKRISEYEELFCLDMRVEDIIKLVKREQSASKFCD